MSQKVILYGKPWCSMVAPVQHALQGARVDFEYVDISQDPQARERVREINNGYESVPTLVFPDGSSLTEPSRVELRTKLIALGHDVATPMTRQWMQAIRDNPLISFSGLLFLGVSVLSGSSVLTGVGAVMLPLVLLNGRFKRRAGQSGGRNL